MNRRGEIAVYAGQGSSPSWTWLADLFEAKGVYGVRFLDVHEFVPHLDAGTSSVIVSGGDGFRIAEGLDGNGFVALRGFLGSGGLYVGMSGGG